ncbi:MAG: circadian clock KaiB family protein [Acidimicrobiales bacterium]
MTGPTDARTPAPEPWLLRLYVAGQSPKSLDAYMNLKAICDEHLTGRYEIEIVDLVEHPDQAAADDVLALPTLIRRLPPPSRRIIGNLSDTERVLGYLSVPRSAAR